MGRMEGRSLNERLFLFIQLYERRESWMRWGSGQPRTRRVLWPTGLAWLVGVQCQRANVDICKVEHNFVGVPLASITIDDYSVSR